MRYAIPYVPIARQYLLCVEKHRNSLRSSMRDSSSTWATKGGFITLPEHVFIQSSPQSLRSMLGLSKQGLCTDCLHGCLVHRKRRHSVKRRDWFCPVFIHEACQIKHNAVYHRIGDIGFCRCLCCTNSLILSISSIGHTRQDSYWLRCPRP